MDIIQAHLLPTLLDSVVYCWCFLVFCMVDFIVLYIKSYVLFKASPPKARFTPAATCGQNHETNGHTNLPVILKFHQQTHAANGGV